MIDNGFPRMMLLAEGKLARVHPADVRPGDMLVSTGPTPATGLVVCCLPGRQWFKYSARFLVVEQRGTLDVWSYKYTASGHEDALRLFSGR